MSMDIHDRTSSKKDTASAYGGVGIEVSYLYYKNIKISAEMSINVYCFSPYITPPYTERRGSRFA